MERFGDVDALDDNVESFLSNDGGDGGNLYGAVKQSPAEQQKESSKGNLYIWLYSLSITGKYHLPQFSFQVSPLQNLVA